MTTAQVALTFHTNGDLSLAERLLAITVQRATPITCFIVGDWLEQHPEWARQAARRGPRAREPHLQPPRLDGPRGTGAG